MADQPIDHVLRPVPPWRDAPARTECGRAINDVACVLTREEFARKLAREGQQRSAMTSCMTCWSTAARWKAWDQDPIECIARDVYADRRSDQLRLELRALALLVAVHQDEFTELLAGLGQTTTIDELRLLRARRGGSRQ